MADEATVFKDEATVELEEFLMQQVQSAVRSELGPIVDDLSDDVRRAVQDVRTDLDRHDREFRDSLQKLEAKLLEKIESLQGQVLERQADTRSTVLKGAKHISAKMAKNEEAQKAELRLIVETGKKLQLFVVIALALSGLAAATSIATLLWNLLG